MANDAEVLRRAFMLEENSTGTPNWRVVGWERGMVGATKNDVDRLVSQQLILMVRQGGGGRTNGYKLSPTGRGLVQVQAEHDERKKQEISADHLFKTLDLVVGYDELKWQIALSLERKTGTHFLLCGPPASAKSVILEGVRRAVPDAYMAFGSGTSGPGLSDVLFERQPEILLLDEVDKMKGDTLSVLLGLMETGDVIETKSRKTRGVKLNTTVLGACNSVEKTPPELIDRWWTFHFPPYTRDEFLDVAWISLARSDNVEAELGKLIGAAVFDHQLGSIREVQRIYREMTEPTREELDRILRLKQQYASPKHKAETLMARMF